MIIVIIERFRQVWSWRAIVRYFTLMISIIECLRSWMRSATTCCYIWMVLERFHPVPAILGVAHHTIAPASFLRWSQVTQHQTGWPILQAYLRINNDLLLELQ
jgi:hypothetical protein